MLEALDWWFFSLKKDWEMIMAMPSDPAVVPLVDLTRGFPRRFRIPLLVEVVRRVERGLGITALNRIYHEVRVRCATLEVDFFRACMEATGLKRQVNPSDLLNIPERGPLVVVANHPLGALDAIALADLLISLRPDTKVVANHLLKRMPESCGRLIPVDPFDGASSGRRNVGPVKQVLGWLRQGGAVLVFPAGEVSHLNGRTMTVTDPAWSPHATHWALRTGASVVPVFVEGRNSWMFQILGLLHPRLRTLLLVREMVRQCGGTVRIHIGRRLPPSTLAETDSPEKITDFLRLQTYVLQGRGGHWKREAATPGIPQVSVADPEHPDAVADEVMSLPGGRLLVRHHQFEVFYAYGSELPFVLREIGRLRELTFREVGEGTGLAADLDGFDGHYLHLFLWDRSARRIAGAYRLGVADEILRVHGVRGLYTRSLFHYGPSFIRDIGPAAELGRSFIHPEYQKQYAALSLLWRGIGEYLVRHPRLHTLFGPVSISRDYHEISRHLLVQFLRRRRQDPVRRWQTRARHPHRGAWIPGLGLDAGAGRLESLEEVSALISAIEDDGKGVPVLLRHYLKLNARLVNFNVDPDFSNALDGLMLVDLRRSDPALIQRFMGREGWASFRRHHPVETDQGTAFTAAG